MKMSQCDQGARERSRELERATKAADRLTLDDWKWSRVSDRRLWSNRVEGPRLLSGI
jgi:hypothetical protein